MDETLFPFLAGGVAPLLLPLPPPLEEEPLSEDFGEADSEAVDSVEQDSEEPPFPFPAESVFFRA